MRARVRARHALRAAPHCPHHTSPTPPQVEVITPEDHMGDVIGDLNSRRGLIQKFEDKPGKMKLVTVRGGAGRARGA